MNWITFTLFFCVASITCLEALNPTAVTVRKRADVCGKCISKCCPRGYNYHESNRMCVPKEPGEIDLLEKKTSIYQWSTKFDEVYLDEYFCVLTGTAACETKTSWNVSQYLQEDGKLYIEMPQSFPSWTVMGPDKYCIDMFVVEDRLGHKTTKLDSLICLFKNDKGFSNYSISSTCMLISCVFILATVGVYAWLPELRNLHGRVLMAYLLCLFVGFFFLATMQILLDLTTIPFECCLALTFIIYFFLQSAFFWLNVMSFDIWWTFSGNRGQSLDTLSTRTRFCAYAIYAFGVPTVLTIILAGLEFSGLPGELLLPNLKNHNSCFLYGKGKLLYLYGPIVILCVANMVFFVLTAVKITQIKKQISVLKSNESAMHDQHRNDKQRLLLYVKLFAVMGISWILEVISVIYPSLSYLWVYTDGYNVFIGLIIFIIFVCKRKILRLLKKRYKQMRGESISKTQTTLTSRTGSGKDEIRTSSNN